MLKHEVLNGAVRLEINRIPANLDNKRLPNYRHPRSGPSKASERWKWRDWVTMLGGSARAAAGWDIATDAIRVTVTITFHRIWPPFDKDGKYAAAKSCLDGLKVVAGRRKGGGEVRGSGLIWDDDDDHLPDADYDVQQVRVSSIADQRTVVEVRRIAREGEAA